MSNNPLNPMMKFDLHIHSHRSYDSVASVKNIIENAKKRGLSGIAITDHEVLTSTDVLEMATQNNIWIIRGIEAKTDIGDIIGLFLSEKLKSRKAADLLDEIHDQGGVAVLAHPFKYMKQIDYYPVKLLEKIDAVETVNARWEDLNLFTNNPMVNQLLSAIRGRSAGSDSHFPFEVGRAYWKTSPVTSPEELKKSICTNAGQAISASFSRWLDGPSQCIKFIKKPTLKQIARMAYWSSRRVVFGKRTIPNE
jgi:predicted metal-dependent phosphoesterase TrpH